MRIDSHLFGLNKTFWSFCWQHTWFLFGNWFTHFSFTWARTRKKNWVFRILKKVSHSKFMARIAFDKCTFAANLMHHICWRVLHFSCVDIFFIFEFCFSHLIFFSFKISIHFVHRSRASFSMIYTVSFYEWESMNCIACPLRCALFWADYLIE